MYSYVMQIRKINKKSGIIPSNIYYKDIKARHLKKLTCKGTLQEVFIRVYRHVIQSVMLVFSTQLFELLPL
jgi:hypothetical protein